MELSTPSAQGVPARQAAISILSDVLRRKRPLDAVADEAMRGSALSPRDAAFARAIAAETLRRFGQLEALVRHFVPRSPPPHKAGPTLEILLSAACELVFLGHAPHAAVDAANTIAAANAQSRHFKPLINAVLRRIAREGAALAAAQDAARLNTPDWLWERWASHYGEAQARAIAAAHGMIAPLDLALKSPAESATPLPEGHRLSPRCVRLREPGRIDALPGYAEGAWWVQDFAAQLPVILLGDVAGKSVIDLCAAPGGKAMQLAAAGARVTAVDIAANRMDRLDQNLSRTGLSAATVIADARDWRPPALASSVLLDAPCSATGTIRRHPDLPWIKSAAGLGALLGLQTDLLDAAASMTAPGGTLVYAVCSLEPEEGIEQVEAFLRQKTDFRRAPVSAAEVFDAGFVTPEGDLRTLPCHWVERGGMDGFYVARLVRAT